jgi:hypothetical protein
MFEAVISQVKTGRVQRQLFGTRDEAEKFLAAEEERLVNPKPQWSTKKDQWVQPKPKSMREYRMEIQFRDAPAVVKVPEKVKTRRKKAA